MTADRDAEQPLPDEPTDREESETPPHPSPADGGDTEPAERPPRPSQAEGERGPE